MKKVYDVTRSIHEGMTVYKNKPEKKPTFTVMSDFSTGSPHETRVALDVHTGTHIDAPLHMIPDGATIETIAIERLVRKCKVFDLSHVEGAIHEQDIRNCNIIKDDFVLLKTRNSKDTEFNFEFIFVAEDAARALAERGVAGVGIDALGVERNQPGYPTHKTLFAHDIIVIEGLDLEAVPEGEYFMVAAPLKLAGLDAAPARVLLLEQD